MTASVPSTLIAGDTWAWTSSFGDYAAPTWDASIYFENQTATYSATATDSGTDHAFSIAAVTTATYTPGRYQWRVRVNDGTTYTTVESGWVDVLVNPAAAGKRDVRSWAKRTLDAVEAFLEGNATTAQQAMTLGNRSISRWSLAELNQWRTQLRQEVRTEEQASAAGIGRNIKVRYGRG